MRLNPVLEREMRERVRGPRATVVLTLFLGGVVGIFSLVFQSGTGFGSRASGAIIDPTVVARLGRSSFEWTLFCLMVLVLFVVPGLTAGSIAGERERQTLVPMQVTLLRPRAIVGGKIQASLAYLALLVTATLPVLAMSYMVGGVSVADVARGVLAVIATGLLAACLGVTASALVRRAQAATGLAYLMVFLLCVGTFVAYGVVGLVQQMNRTRFEPDVRPPVAILWLNPVVATSTVVGGRGADGNQPSGDSPFSGLRSVIAPAVDRRFVAAGGMIEGDLVGPNGAPIGQIDAGALGNAVDQASTDIRNFGLASGVSLAGLAAGAVALASRKVRTPAETER